MPNEATAKTDKPKFKETFKKEWNEHRGKTILYIILRVLVVVTLIAQAFNQNWDNVFLCVLTLILFMIPTFVDKRMKITMPTALEVIVLLFIFSAEILGEIREYYLKIDSWDTILHTLNGFLAAAIGLALIDILNKSDKVSLDLSPPYVAFTAFCFANTVGVIWEFFEYGMDRFFGTDMQKDTWIDTVTSVELNPAGTIEPATIDIESIIVNGQEWPMYLDIGLIDTMKDMFVNFIGATVFSILGYLFLSGKIKGNFIKNLTPTKRRDED